MAHYLNVREEGLADDEGKVRMRLVANEAAAVNMDSSFADAPSSTRGYVEPYAAFVRFAGVLLAAGENGVQSTAPVSIIEQKGSSGLLGHFSAWVRDSSQQSMGGCSATELVTKVRASPYMPCARAVSHTPVHSCLTHQHLSQSEGARLQRDHPEEA